MQNDKAIRVFRKSKSRYRLDRMVHEIVEYEGNAGFLKNKFP